MAKCWRTSRSRRRRRPDRARADGEFGGRTQRPGLTGLIVTDTVLIMTTNSRLASAVHIMSFVAHAGDEGTTSEAIAKSLKTNPVVVRKLLKLLEGEGLVALRQGRYGGVGLQRPASSITLGQIYRAVESESGVF